MAVAVACQPHMPQAQADFRRSSGSGPSCGTVPCRLLGPGHRRLQRLEGLLCPPRRRRNCPDAGHPHGLPRHRHRRVVRLPLPGEDPPGYAGPWFPSPCRSPRLRCLRKRAPAPRARRLLPSAPSHAENHHKRQELQQLRQGRLLQPTRGRSHEVHPGVDDLVQRITRPVSRTKRHLEAAGQYVLRGLRHAGFTVSAKTTSVTTDRGLSARLVAAFPAAEVRARPPRPLHPPPHFEAYQTMQRRTPSGSEDLSARQKPHQRADHQDTRHYRDAPFRHVLLQVAGHGSLPVEPPHNSHAPERGAAAPRLSPSPWETTNLDFLVEWSSSVPGGHGGVTTQRSIAPLNEPGTPFALVLSRRRPPDGGAALGGHTAAVITTGIRGRLRFGRTPTEKNGMRPQPYPVSCCRVAQQLSVDASLDPLEWRRRRAGPRPSRRALAAPVSVETRQTRKVWACSRSCQRFHLVPCTPPRYTARHVPTGQVEMDFL